MARRSALNRELGLFHVTVAGVGIILGAGIYALIGFVAGTAGNATWLSFLISAVVAGFTGLSYAELSSFFRGDGGEYDYCKAAFGHRFAWFIALLIIFTGIVSSAAVALGFAGYFTQIVSIPFIWASFLIILLMSIINFIGIGESNRFNTIATGIEFFGLVVIIVLGIGSWGSVDVWSMPQGLGGVFQAGALAFFAFMGFETIIKLREEAKDPDRTIPRAIILSILITAIVYVLVGLSAVSLMPWEELAVSSSPLADVAAVKLGSIALIGIGIIALFSTSNTVLLTMLTTSRMIYGVARERVLPSALSKVNGKTKTPHIAIFVTTFLTLVVAGLGNIELIADITTIFLFVTFALVNLAAIILRYRDNSKRSFKMPVNIGRFPVLALLGIVASLVMLVFSLINLV